MNYIVINNGGLWLTLGEVARLYTLKVFFSRADNHMVYFNEKMEEDPYHMNMNNHNDMIQDCDYLQMNKLSRLDCNKLKVYFLTKPIIKVYLKKRMWVLKTWTLYDKWMEFV